MPITERYEYVSNNRYPPVWEEGWNNMNLYISCIYLHYTFGEILRQKRNDYHIFEWRRLTLY